MEGASRPAVITLSRLNHPPVVNRVPYRLSRLVLFCASAVSLIFASCKSRFIGVILAPFGGSCLRTVFTVGARRIKGFIGLVTGGTRFHIPIIEGFLFKAKPRFFIPLVLATYLIAGLSFIPSNKITYADPIMALQLPPAQPMLTMPPVTPVQALPYVVTPKTDNLANLYAWGNCTAYVASKLPVPSDWGNAIDWGTNAQSQGYVVSDIPLVGSIAWSTTDSYLGHVALVVGVDGDVVTVSEMNYQGLGVVDTRVANPGEFQFIYL